MSTMRRTSSRRQIAGRLKKRRLASGISQENAAKKLRIRRNQWSRIELGLQSIPAERLVDVCEVVNTTVAELLNIPIPAVA